MGDISGIYSVGTTAKKAAKDFVYTTIAGSTIGKAVVAALAWASAKGLSVAYDEGTLTILQDGTSVAVVSVVALASALWTAARNYGRRGLGLTWLP